MTTTGPAACHNCRRQRLKCDKTLPGCQKCGRRGQECLGYGRLLRWEPGVASRGKMAGLTFGCAMKNDQRRDVSSSAPIITLALPMRNESQPLPRLFSLTDPLLQDLDRTSRKYLAYYASDLCKDLVLYDTPNRNPFRDLICMTEAQPMLLNIVVASAALHMSNAGNRCELSSYGSPSSDSTHSSSVSSQSRWSVVRSHEPYRDALAAKQRALHHLRQALARRDTTHTDITLATVLLFTEFELLDSGRDTWRHHINGAREIITALWKPELASDTSLSPLRSCLISTCMVFDIIGSTITQTTPSAVENSWSNSHLSLLQDAEGNHCSSFPAEILQLVQKGAGLLSLDESSTRSHDRENVASKLLNAAFSFDPTTWAGKLRSRSPTNDHLKREHIAFAHRAAACIYLSRTLMCIAPTYPLDQDLEALVTDVVYHLSFIQPGDELLNASTWPAFIAGAETQSFVQQAWIVRRFEELWTAEPWGLFRAALEVLEGIWQRRAREQSLKDKTPPPSSSDFAKTGNWLTDLRAMGADWLII